MRPIIINLTYHHSLNSDVYFRATQYKLTRQLQNELHETTVDDRIAENTLTGNFEYDTWFSRGFE